MSKPSRRPNRAALKQQRKEKKNAEKQLLARQRAQGLDTQVKPSIKNGLTSDYLIETFDDSRQIFV